jgi:hypothetical protein
LGKSSPCVKLHAYAGLCLRSLYGDDASFCSRKKLSVLLLKGCALLLNRLAYPCCLSIDVHNGRNALAERVMLLLEGLPALPLSP